MIMNKALELFWQVQILSAADAMVKASRENGLEAIAQFYQSKSDEALMKITELHSPESET